MLDSTGKGFSKTKQKPNHNQKQQNPKPSLNSAMNTQASTEETETPHVIPLAMVYRNQRKRDKGEKTTWLWSSLNELNNQTRILAREYNNHEWFELFFSKVGKHALLGVYISLWENMNAFFYLGRCWKGRLLWSSSFGHYCFSQIFFPVR